LLDVRLRDTRNSSNGLTIDRRVAPTQNRQSFFLDDPLQHAFAVQPRRFLHWKKRHADGVFARRRQLNSKRGALARKKLVRNLNQHARTVARLRIATAGTTVRQVDQDLNALLNDGVALLPTDARHKPNAAGIALGRRVIKTLRRRQTVVCLPMLQNNAPGLVVGVVSSAFSKVSYAAC